MHCEYTGFESGLPSPTVCGENQACFPGTDAACHLAPSTLNTEMCLLMVLESQVRLRKDRKEDKEMQGERLFMASWKPIKYTHHLSHFSHLPGFHTFGGICILWHIQGFWNTITTRKKERRKEGGRGRV